VTKFAITGADGYVGSRISEELAKHGKVIQLGSAQFSLGQRGLGSMLKGADVLIHCAYDFTLQSWNEIERVNVQGSLALFAAARRAGVKRIIFISSMSAFDGCRSNYGRAKLAIERSARKYHPQVVIVRPGLVYDERPGGVVGSMRKLARLPLVPLIGGKQQLYYCHSADLAKAIYKLSKGAAQKPVYAACSKQHSFGEALRILVPARYVPVPAGIAYVGLRMAEIMHIPLGLRSDSLVGLMNPNPHPEFTLKGFRDLPPMNDNYR
jgi:nucleoside-diphosphate-sugar epimerase